MPFLAPLVGTFGPNLGVCRTSFSFVLFLGFSFDLVCFVSEEEVPLLERMEKGMLTEGVPAGIPRDKSEGEESRGGDHGLPSLLLVVRTSVL